MNATQWLSVVWLGTIVGCASSSGAPQEVIAPSAISSEASKPPATPPSAPRPPVATPTTRFLFCAYGGIGMVPSPPPPDLETSFGEIVVEIDNGGPPIRALSVQHATLLDSTSTVASLRRVDHLVALPPSEKPTPERGIFAVFMNPPGTPLDGFLNKGTTRLRVRFSLDHAPTSPPSRCRLELGGFGAPLVIEGALNGTWPT